MNSCNNFFWRSYYALQQQLAVAPLGADDEAFRRTLFQTNIFEANVRAILQYYSMIQNSIEWQQWQFQQMIQRQVVTAPLPWPSPPYSAGHAYSTRISGLNLISRCFLRNGTLAQNLFRSTFEKM